jgi:archaellum component FlaG (FlaF/FlaG flagellin family)
MNISQATSSLFKTGKDFAGDRSGNASALDKSRAESQRVDTELERIHTDTVDVKKELGELDQDSSLKPPSFKSVSNKSLVIATASGGAVLGGAIGLLSAVASGPATVNFNEVRHDITQQKLNGTGFDIRTYTVGGTPQNPEGWDVDITRRPLTNEKVGEYTSREPVASNTTSVLLSGAIGVGLGAAVGAGVGLAGIGLRKVLKQEYDGTAPRQTEGDNKILITGGVAGAVVGAAAGALSALVQSNTVSYETQSIKMETKVIGEVPRGDGNGGGGFYIPATGGNNVPANAEAVQRLMNGNIDKLARDGYRNVDHLRPEEVRGQVPNRTVFGNLDIDSETRETKVGPSMLGSVAGGAAIGAVTGVAGGVLLNVLRKSL